MESRIFSIETKYKIGITYINIALDYKIAEYNNKKIRKTIPIYFIKCIHYIATL